MLNSVFQSPIVLPAGISAAHKRMVLEAMRSALVAEYNYHRAMFIAGAYTQADIDAYEDQHDALMKEIGGLLNAV